MYKLTLISEELANRVDIARAKYDIRDLCIERDRLEMNMENLEARYIQFLIDETSDWLAARGETP